MAGAHVKNVGSATAKASGTALSVTVPAAGIAVGNQVLVRASWDPLSGTTPTGSVTDSRGNVWTALTSTVPTNAQTGQTAPTTAAGTGALTSTYIATVASGKQLVSGDTITLTLSGAVVARTLVADELSGLTTSLRGTPNTIRSIGTNTSPNNSIDTPALTAGDAAVVVMSTESAAGYGITTAPAGWTRLTVVATSGGAAATNVATDTWVIASAAAGVTNHNVLLNQSLLNSFTAYGVQQFVEAVAASAVRRTGKRRF